MQHCFHLMSNLYTIRRTFLLNYIYVGITVEAVLPQLVEVPGNPDFTKAQFWLACPCVTNDMLTAPHCEKEKATFANRSVEYRSPLPFATLY